MLVDALLELRDFQDQDPRFELGEAGRANTANGRFVLRSLAFPVTFGHDGKGQVEVTINVVISPGLRTSDEARSAARDSSRDFLAERLPEGFEVAESDPRDPNEDRVGAFVVRGAVPMDEAKAEIEAIQALDPPRDRVVRTRFKAGPSYGTYASFLEGPPRPMGLAAIKKASQRD